MFFNSKFTLYVCSKRIKYLKNLNCILKKQSGRSNIGRLIFLGRGGGKKKYYRLIDFKRLINNIPFKILYFFYDPNRNIFIMLILYLNGVLVYNLTPLLIKLNMYLINNHLSYLINGNSFLLYNCLIGSFVHCVQVNNMILKYGRSAGVYIQIIRKIGSYVLLRLPSKEELFIYNKNLCILGRLSGLNVKLIKKTSAGFNRRLGLKSKVRGVAKNPIDHPHGGGEGKTSSGRPSVSPWGIYTKGVRTTTRFKRKSFLNWGFFRRRDGLVW